MSLWIVSAGLASQANGNEAAGSRVRTGHYDMAGVVGFFLGIEGSNLKILIRNIGGLPIEVTGLSNAQGRTITKFISSSVIKPKPFPINEIILDAVSTDIHSEYALNKIYLDYNYINPDTDERIKAPSTQIIPFKPQNPELRQATQIRTLDNLNEFDFVETDGEEVRFKGDAVTVNRMLFIPPGRKFVLRAGQTVDLVD
jgi:hypothetical protein